MLRWLKSRQLYGVSFCLSIKIHQNNFYHLPGTIKKCRLWERPKKEIAVVSHGIFLQQTLCALHEKVSIPLEDSLLTRLIIRFLKLINQSHVNLSVLTCNWNHGHKSSYVRYLISIMTDFIDLFSFV